jgi:chorismate synthase
MMIRELQGPEELAWVEELQRVIWGRDERDVVPKGLLRAIQDEGGLVAGAFEQELVGFVFGFPTQDPTLQHSHMLGVLPEVRGKSYALALKRYQRDWCLSRGIRTVRWTFDPLRGPNARFNLSKLGAYAETLLPDYYGPMSGLNRGAPSDRFLTIWPLTAPRTLERLWSSPPPPPPAPLVNRVVDEVPLGFDEREEAQLFVQIPEDWGGILQGDPALALRWREHTRAVFQHYFERGYQAVELVRHPNRYLLVRKEQR